jgi:hypothetical protein
VLPLHSVNGGRCDCNHADCTAPGKHPLVAGGLDAASRNPTQIRAWWLRREGANIGIVTGAVSGVVVIDQDNKNGLRGTDAFAALAAEHDGALTTLTASTGGGGQHSYFKHPGVPISNSASKLGPGIDVKGDRGYVVAPPSRHANGNEYAWINPDRPMAQVPDWLLRMLTTTRDQKANAATRFNGQSPLRDAQPVHEGQRNDVLFKLGSILRGQHAMTAEEIEAALLEFNETKCVPPLDPVEVVNIAGSVCRYPAETKPKRPDKDPSLRWFKLDTHDFALNPDVALMSDAQTGWYLWLMVFAYKNCGYIPSDPEKLWKLAHAKTHKAFVRGCAPVLRQFTETCCQGGELMLKHEDLAQQYSHAYDLVNKRREAGRIAAEKARAKQEEGQHEKRAQD